MIQQSWRSFQYFPGGPICPNTKGTSFIWVFIVLGTYNFDPRTKLILCEMGGVPLYLIVCSATQFLKKKCFDFCNFKMVGFSKNA